MELERRNGQAFILGAVLFSGLFLLASLPSGPSIDSGGSSDIRGFFSESLEAEQEVFNREISKNSSTEHLKRKIYTYNQFIEQSSGLKGASFSSYHFLAVPERGKAVFINYRDEKTDLTYWNTSRYSFTVDPMQSQELSIREGQDLNLTDGNTGNTHRLEVYRPRLVYWMKMVRDQQTVQRSYTG